MVRAEFDAIWSSEKSIVGDVVFAPAKGTLQVFTADNIEVLGMGFDGLYVNLSFDCQFRGLVCNFTLRGIGAIHRYCIGATIHGDAGRFHEHQIMHGDCVRQQLPHVVARDDLREMTSEERWHTICQEANITFTGTFFSPEVQCS
jgi:hypothetical protein